MTGERFVPPDIRNGEKFGLHWILPFEYQFGLVRDVDRYKQWLETRVGNFF